VKTALGIPIERFLSYHFDDIHREEKNSR